LKKNFRKIKLKQNFIKNILMIIILNKKMIFMSMMNNLTINI